MTLRNILIITLSKEVDEMRGLRSSRKDAVQEKVRRGLQLMCAFTGTKDHLDCFLQFTGF